MSRILIADDHAGIRQVASLFLRREHEVESVSSGEAAWARLQQAAFDVVLTDVCMHDVSGLELLRRIRAAQPQVRVIVMSARPDFRAEALALGAETFVEKPFSLAGLTRAVAARSHAQTA